MTRDRIDRRVRHVAASLRPMAGGRILVLPRGHLSRSTSALDMGTIGGRAT